MKKKASPIHRFCTNSSIAICSNVTVFAVSDEQRLAGSNNAEQYNAGTSTATLTSANNAADMKSKNMVAKVGDTLVFDNLDFTGAKCLMMTAPLRRAARTRRSICRLAR